MTGTEKIAMGSIVVGLTVTGIMVEWAERACRSSSNPSYKLCRFVMSSTEPFRRSSAILVTRGLRANLCCKRTAHAGDT